MLIEEPAFADVRSGWLAPPAAPGTGLRLNTQALERYAYRHTNLM